MDRLVLVDAHAIIHRAYHALPPLTNSKGKQMGAVYGFISMLIRVIRVLKPTHLTIAFDRPTPTFRKKIFKEYQAQRPEIDIDLVPQIGMVHDLVEKLGIPIFEMDGYEADDVIGSLASQAMNQKVSTKGLNHRPIGPWPRSSFGRKSEKSRKKLEVIIVTGDRDILQLINDRVKVFMPVKGLSEGKIFGEKEIVEKFGIKSSQMIDYKALVGDASDNYPGVAGIGPKTARDLLQKFHTLENLYKHLDNTVKEKTRQKLIDNKESAEMAKRLATIVVDVPIELNLKKCKIRLLDRPYVHKLFTELGFDSLIPRLSEQAIEQSSNPAIKKKSNKVNAHNKDQLTLLK